MTAFAPSAGATEEAYKYNSLMKSYSECIPLRDGATNVRLWNFDGTATGFLLDGIKFSGCDPGEVRVQQRPPLKINGKTMYFNRGGAGSTNQEEQAGSCSSPSPLGTCAIRHAHIWVYDLQRRPKYEYPAEGNNAKPCPTPQNPVWYYNNPQGTAPYDPTYNPEGVGIPQDLYYKRPQDVGLTEWPIDGGSNWQNYGDPPQQQGHYRPAGVHYNGLLWNWMWGNNTGGGQYEATMKKNQRIMRCDVASITSKAYDRRGNSVGEVRGVYGRISVPNGFGGTTVAHGWFVHSWRRNGFNIDPATGQPRWSYLVSSNPVP